MSQLWCVYTKKNTWWGQRPCWRS